MPMDATEAVAVRVKFTLPKVSVTLAPIPVMALPTQLPDDVEVLKALLRSQHQAHVSAIAWRAIT